MKPKTKLQKEVYALSKKLKPLTEKQKDWAFEKCFMKYFTKRGKDLICFECGHRWKNNDSSLGNALLGSTCPCCESNLSLYSYPRKSKFSEIDYFCIYTTSKGYQVIRVFYIRKSCQIGSCKDLFVSEVAQHWINKNGIKTTLTRSSSFMWASAFWAFDSELQIRSENSRSTMYNSNLYDVNPYPAKRFISELKRNGFNGLFHGHTPADMFALILSDNKAETLLKCGQLSLFSRFDTYKHKIHKYWGSIKICIRHGYIIDQVALWLDLMDLLEWKNKDLLNPKLVCPDDLLGDHNRLNKKKKEFIKKQNREKLIKSIEEANVEYIKTKDRYIGIKFKEEDITVSVIDNVMDFYNEGIELNHCVFNNEYYKREESLLLSAKKGDTRLETIEVSLKNFQIMQCYGLNNKPTQYHDKILSIVQNNLSSIRQIAS